MYAALSFVVSPLASGCDSISRRSPVSPSPVVSSGVFATSMVSGFVTTVTVVRAISVSASPPRFAPSTYS